MTLLRRNKRTDQQKLVHSMLEHKSPRVSQSRFIPSRLSLSLLFVLCIFTLLEHLLVRHGKSGHQKDIQSPPEPPIATNCHRVVSLPA